VILAAFAVLLAVAAVTVVIVRTGPADAMAGDSVALLAGGIAVSAAVVGAALRTLARRPGARFPLLLAGAGVAWLLSDWDAPGAGVAFSTGLLLWAAWPSLLAHGALRAADDAPLGRAMAAVVTAGYVITVGVLGLAAATVFDPSRQGCVECPPNHLLLTSDPRMWESLGRAGLTLAAAWSAATVTAAVIALARSSRARRRLRAPVLLPAVSAVALFGVQAVHGAGSGFVSNDPVDRALWAAQGAALALVAAGLVSERIRAHRARTTLARLVVELGQAPPPGGLRDQLAAALGDPSLELVHAFDDGGGWVDGHGRPAILGARADRQETRLVAGDRAVSVLVHRPGLLDDPAVAEELAASARLALEHERLHAVRRAQLERLRASRARIVATADAERRRLERDLHDGAQQRLVTLAVGIRLARRRLAAGDPALDAGLAAAEDELQAAVAELRELAHGLVPAVLVQEGLAAAIDALADRAPQLVPGPLLDERFPAPVETAAYSVVAEALRRAGEGDVTVAAHRENGLLVVDVHADAQISAAVTDLEDRVGALGGTVAAGPHHLRAELPCAS
jgi:signal transduction histidine kinase